MSDVVIVNNGSNEVLKVTNEELVIIENSSQTTEILEVSPRGESGAGVRTGGTTGQYLRKSSDTDYDTEWADATAFPWTTAQW